MAHSDLYSLLECAGETGKTDRHTDKCLYACPFIVFCLFVVFREESILEVEGDQGYQVHSHVYAFFFVF